jgi:dipeptidyl-peptidase-4
LYLPPKLQEDEITKYPMLVNTYGGPGSQQVNDAFRVNWGHRLATAKNIIYCLIDGRGSGYQGDKRLFELYHRLGTVEVEDQIQVTRFVKDYEWNQ